MSERTTAPSIQDRASDGFVHTICMDLLYPIHPGDGSIIVNHANFSWSSSAAPRLQFLAAARAKALEYDRPVLIAANDGPTAAIERTGAIVQALPFHARDVLQASVTLSQTITLYARAGDAPFLVIATLLIAAGVLPLRRRGARPVTTDLSQKGTMAYEQQS